MKRNALAGFRPFTLIQGLLITGLLLKGLATGDVYYGLGLGMVALSACGMWSLVRYFRERRQWNNGIAPSGLPWAYRSSSLVSKLYFDGFGPRAQTLWLTHYRPDSAE